jgi:hypothetical protein
MEPIPDIERNDVDVVSNMFAEQAEQFFKEKRRSNYSWASIISKAISFENLGPTPQARAAIKYGYIVSLGA